MNTRAIAAFRRGLAETRRGGVDFSACVVSRPWLARIIGPTGDSPHLSALHSGGHSETASTKS